MQPKFTYIFDRQECLDTHKYSFGSGLLFSGQKARAGAAILASRAALRSGIGVLSIWSEECNYGVYNTAVPEAILFEKSALFEHSTLDDAAALDKSASLDTLAKYDALAIGPAWGLGKDRYELLDAILRSRHSALLAHSPHLPHFQALVLDADALSIIAKERALLDYLQGVVLTPHLGEFSRLVQKDLSSASEEEILLYLNDFVRTTGSICVLKKYFKSLKANAVVATPKFCRKGGTELELNCGEPSSGGELGAQGGGFGASSGENGSGTNFWSGGEVDFYANTSGNPALATAGSGDVLTGIILSFLAQEAASRKAAAAAPQAAAQEAAAPISHLVRLAVYVHGRAADLAVKKMACASVIASDIVDHIPYVIKEMEVGFDLEKFSPKINPKIK